MKTSLSSPLNLRERVKKQSAELIDVLSLMSVAAVAVMLYLMNSTYIFAPGLTLDVDAPTDGSAYVLPRSSAPLPGVPADGVFTMRNDRQFLFEGRIFRTPSDALPPQKSGIPVDRGTLLLKLDRGVTMQGFFEIVDAAKAAGYTKIQVAGEENLQKAQ